MIRTYNETTWMRYLPLGISILISMGYSSCGKKRVEYLQEGTYIFLNSTSFVIDVKGVNPFILNPSQTHTIYIVGEGPKDVTHKGYSPPFGGAIIKFDNIICDTIESSKESILNIENYANEKVAERHYKFTYTFTAADYNKGVPCK